MHPQYMCLLLVFLLVTPCLCENCTPFGLRTSFGQAYSSPTSSELFELRFNTADECRNSFVFLVQDTFSTAYPCTSDLISIKNQTTFKTYVHVCSMVNLQYNLDIEYRVYGVDSAGTATVGKTMYISLVDPKMAAPNQFIVLADWSKLINKQYTTLESSFNVLLQNRTDIHGVILIGDIGYDLETNECQNYIGFLEILEQIAAVWPTIIVTGNHQYVSKNNWDLYIKSFQLYDLVKERKIKTHIFKWFSLVTFDPYKQIYGTATAEQTSRYLADLKAQYKAVAELAVPWRIASSHYPLLCSCSTKNCSGVNSTLGEFFWAMNDQKFNMYLGAHTHIYERIFPYFKGKVLEIEGPYHNIDSMVSVVDGVAGNEKDIVEEIYKLKSFTAKATFNQTGFGILTAYNWTHLEYKHYSTKGGMHLVDQVLMTQYEGNREAVM